MFSEIRRIIDKFTRAFAFPLFILIVAINLVIVGSYDYLYYDKIAQYKQPPLISLIYDAENEQLLNEFNTLYLAEFILVISLIILLTVPKSLFPLHIIFPGLVIALGFWAYDVEIQAHQRIPTINTLTILFTFKDILGIEAIVWGIGIVLLLVLSFYYTIKGFWISIKEFTNSSEALIKLQFILILITKLLALALILLTPLLFFDKYYKDVWWYDKQEVWTNGRLTAFYKHSIQEIQADLELDKFEYAFSQPPHRILFSDTLDKFPNIYFILLESHLDLSRLKNVSFSKFPIHPNLLKFMPDSSFSLIKSPVIGGFTAQATFEVLTGTPALHELSPVEFLVFGNHPTSSLLRRLKEQGYNTFAIVANSDIFFNMPKAYKDLGFDSSIFLGSISPYKESYTDKNMFIPDKETYGFFLKHLEDLSEPRFVYIVTMYGHWPWYMPLDSDTISVSPKIESLPELANVIFKKQKLLAQLIDTILKTDSNALIVAFTDHNPPFVLTDTTKLKYDAPSIYHVPILIIYKGRKVNIPIVEMHRVPEIIYHLIANDTLPDTSNLVPMEIKRYLYKQIIKQSREDT